jgi:hypothetical protein
MPRQPTRIVSTKVTEDDYAMFEQLAGDQPVGEGVREVLFMAVLSERTAEAHRTILSELLALRKILLNLQFSVAAGEVGEPRSDAQARTAELGQASPGMAVTPDECSSSVTRQAPIWRHCLPRRALPRRAQALAARHPRRGRPTKGRVPGTTESIKK